MKVHVAPAVTTPAAADPAAFSIDELVRLSGGRTAAGDIPLDLEIVWNVVAQPNDVRRVIESVRIETLGQLVRDPADPTRWRLSRLVITCCAADARAVSVAIGYAGDPTYWQPLGWYRAVGRVEETECDGSWVPLFQLESMTPAEPPQQRMLY